MQRSGNERGCDSLEEMKVFQQESRAPERETGWLVLDLAPKYGIPGGRVNNECGRNSPPKRQYHF